MLNYRSNIFSKSTFFSIFYRTLLSFHLDGDVNNVTDSNDIEFARFNVSKSVMLFNYNNLVLSANKFSKYYNFEDISEFNEFVNLFLLQVMYHEIIHIIQNCHTNDKILQYATLRENKLKEMSEYNKFKYLNNPIERQANISSLTFLIQNVDCSNTNNLILMNKLSNYLLFGYNNCCPIYEYFNGSDHFEHIVELSSEINDFERKLEYGCDLSQSELILLKERCLWKRI